MTEDEKYVSEHVERITWQGLYDLPAGTVVRCLEDEGLGMVKVYAGRETAVKVVQWDDGCVTIIRPNRAGLPSIVVNARGLYKFSQERIAKLTAQLEVSERDFTNLLDAHHKVLAENIRLKALIEPRKQECTCGPNQEHNCLIHGIS